MEKTPTECCVLMSSSFLQLQKNALLTLCSDRILNDVVSEHWLHPEMCGVQCMCMCPSLNRYLYETLGKNFIKEENNKKLKFLHFVSLFLLFIKMKNKELFAEERRKSALMVNED